MRLLLMHVADAPPPWPDEDALIIVPGGAKVATAWPFHALDRAIPMFAEALADLPSQTCDACGGALTAEPMTDRP